MTDQLSIHVNQGEAISKAHEALADALDATDGALALPKDFNVIDLERFLSTRRRVAGTYVTGSIESFCAYIKRHARTEGSAIFMHPKSMGATAILDFGTVESPGHCSHRAELELALTGAFNAVSGIANASTLQRAFVEWVEDWRDCITFFAGADEIPMPKALGALRSITVESARRLETNIQSLSASKSTFESVTAGAKDTLPDYLYFKCKPTDTHEERTFVLRLGVVTSGDRVSISARAVQWSEHIDQIGEEMANAITEEVDGDIPVLQGAFTTD